MPGAFTSTRRALVGLDRALAVDRIAERVDHAAEQALADRHVDDRAGALDGLAFLDLAVVAEDHDADVVGFEVERHAAHAVLELDHLAGLDVVEAVDAGDAVADRQHLADFGDFGLLAEILDLLLQDRGDFCGADVHQPASFIACLIALSLVRSELSTMRLPSLTISPPMIAGSTLTLRSTALSPVTDLSAALSASRCASEQLFGDRDLGGDLALQRATSLRKPRIMSRTANSRRLAAIELQEIGGEAADAGLVEHGGERLALLLGAEHRAAHQAVQIGALGDQRVELFQIGPHRVDRLALERELEQRRRVAPSHAGYDRFFACHVGALEVKSAGSAPSRGGTAQTLGIQGSFWILGAVAGNPTKIARFRNISIDAVQHAQGRENPAKFTGRRELAHHPLRPARCLPRPTGRRPARRSSRCRPGS